MSQILTWTPIEIRKAGWHVLEKHLGLTGALQFFLQYEKGEGDYTELRRELFKGETVGSLISRMKKEGKIRGE
jgi:hypothetical protein